MDSHISTLQMIRNYMSSDNEEEMFAEQYLNTYPLEFITTLSEHVDELVSSPNFLKVIEKLLDQIEEVDDNLDEQISRLSFNIFTKCLICQPDENLSSEYSLSEAGGIGMGLLGDNFEGMFQIALPFLTTHLTNTNWRYQDAAIMIYSSIICSSFENNLQISSYLQQSLPLLLSLLQSNNSLPIIRSSIVWTIGRLLSRKLPLLLSLHVDLSQLLTPLLTALNDSHPKVLSQSLQAICSFASAASEISDYGNYPILIQYIQPTLQQLFQLTLNTHQLPQTSTENENNRVDENILALVYETISCVISSAHVENVSDMNLILLEVIQRFQVALTSDRSLLPCLCSVLFALLSQVESDVLLSQADILTNLLIQVTYLEETTILSESLLAFSKLVEMIPAIFERHHTVITTRVIQLLQQGNDCSIELCEFVGALSHVMTPTTFQDGVTLLTALLTKLREDSSTNNKKTQSALIFAIGDLFLGIEAHHIFQFVAPYLDYLRILQTSDLFEGEESDGNDEGDDIDDVIDRDEKQRLIEGIITSYTSVVQGIKTSQVQPLRSDLLSPHLHVMIHLIRHTTISRRSNISNTVTKESIGLLGDLWTLFGERIEEHISRNEILQFLTEHPSIDRPNADYLRNQIRRGPAEGANEMSTDE